MKLLKKSNFHGGIHPADGSDKILSNQQPIRILNPETVEISMKQSAGSVCKAIVKEGDQVSLGQLIAESSGFGSANIHASISGKVTEIRKTKDEQSNEVEVVVIQSSENMVDHTTSKTMAYQNRILDISGITKEEIITSMKEGGLIGLGGAGFPTHVKYETPKPIKYVLINAAECEPYLTCDHRLMLEYGYEILNGIQLLIKAAGAKMAYLCLEDNKEDAANHLQQLLEGQDLPMELVLLHTKYPQGGERQLVEAVIKKEIPAGSLPADIGVIINNVGTAKAMADIMFTKTPLIARCITVTGKVKNPGNFYVPIGTPYATLIHEAGGFTTKNNRVIIGGPMTGNSIMIGGELTHLEGSVSKTSSGLLVLEDYSLIESPCIRCGECERVCPAGLAPFKIDFAAIEDNINLCEKLYATECISCGSCSYVCPANRELAYRITVAKTEIFNLRREKGGKR